MTSIHYSVELFSLILIFNKTLPLQLFKKFDDINLVSLNTAPCKLSRTFTDSCLPLQMGTYTKTILTHSLSWKQMLVTWDVLPCDLCIPIFLTLVFSARNYLESRCAGYTRQGILSIRRLCFSWPHQLFGDFPFCSSPLSQLQKKVTRGYHQSLQQSIFGHCAHYDVYLVHNEQILQGQCMHV